MPLNFLMFGECWKTHLQVMKRAINIQSKERGAGEGNGREGTEGWRKANLFEGL
jgi:hypothetical protein